MKNKAERTFVKMPSCTSYICTHKSACLENVVLTFSPLCRLLIKSASSLPGSMPPPLLHSHPSHPRPRRILDLFLPRHLSHCIVTQLTSTSANSKFLEGRAWIPGTEQWDSAAVRAPTTSVKTLPVALGSVCIFDCIFSLASRAHFAAPVADQKHQDIYALPNSPQMMPGGSWHTFTPPGWENRDLCSTLTSKVHQQC